MPRVVGARVLGLGQAVTEVIPAVDVVTAMIKIGIGGMVRVRRRRRARVRARAKNGVLLLRV